MITTRAAGALDARQMAELLNGIIAEGGTTALTQPVTRQDMTDWMSEHGARSAWRIAEMETGDIVGFQWIAPYPKLPPEACTIASFVQIGRTGLGIGSKLFEATKAAARGIGYEWINATIRADNESGLTYYQSRGFEDYGREKNVRLDDGQLVDRVHKRYQL